MTTFCNIMAKISIRIRFFQLPHYIQHVLDNVALSLKNATDQVRLLPLINTLSPRLTQLVCHYDLFKQEHALRPLSLDFCHVEELNSFREFFSAVNSLYLTMCFRQAERRPEA